MGNGVLVKRRGSPKSDSIAIFLSCLEHTNIFKNLPILDIENYFFFLSALQSMQPGEVIVAKWASPLRYQYFRNLLPDMSVTKCETCNKMFHTDDYELQLFSISHYFLLLFYFHYIFVSNFVLYNISNKSSPDAFTAYNSKLHLCPQSNANAPVPADPPPPPRTYFCQYVLRTKNLLWTFKVKLILQFYRNHLHCLFT